MFSEVAEIALVAARLGQFQQLPKTRVILILNFTRPHAITYTYHVYNYRNTLNYKFKSSFCRFPTHPPTPHPH